MTATATRPTTLPDFEEQEVTGSAVRVTNAGDGLSEAMTIGKKALHIGDEVYYVLRGEVTQVNHRADPKDGDITRVHTVKAAQITEVDGKLAQQILAAAAEKLQKARDEAEGQLRLEEEQAAVDAEKLDDTGTPAEVADLAKKRATGES